MPSFNIYNRYTKALMTTQTGDSFKRAVVAAVRANVSLAQADLSNQDLSDCDFRGGTFTSADFTNSRVDGSLFQGVDLSSATTTNLSAKGAKFNKANLSGVTTSVWNTSPDTEGHK